MEVIVSRTLSAAQFKLHEQNRPRVQLNYVLQPAAPSILICRLYLGIDLMRIRNSRKGGRVGFAWVCDAKRLLFFN